MLLTFFTVGSIFLLDTEGFNRKRQAIRVTGAIILMGCATLTKGPVGALLPCLIVGVYRLFRRRNFFVTVLKLSACAIAAFAIASVWYYAAYLQGGSHFLDLAMEENIGRLTGTMTYDSHLNPWYYNLICVAYGMSPYIILAILAAIALNRKSRNGRPVENIRNARTDNSENGADTLLAWCGAVLTIGFYCIPASKRSTYLLPAYPFMAFGIVLLYNRLRNIRSQMPKYFARFMATLAVTVTLAMTILRSGMADSLAHGKNAAYILAIADGPMSWWEWIILWLPLASVAAIRRLAPDLDQLAKAVTYTVTIYIAFLCTIQPLLLNPRSNISAAAEVESMASGSTPIYSYLGDDPYMRYFTMNYYLGDRMRMLEKDAVKIGGGKNHRIGLFDMILIKDNHVDFAGGITAAVSRAKDYCRNNGKNLKIEVEVRNEDEINEAIAAGVDRIMLDNFTPERTKEAVAIIRKAAPGVEIESSGGITFDTLRAYGEAGVDFVSVGALTHSVKGLDLSFKAC